MIRLERYLQMQDEILLVSVQIASLRQTKGPDYDAVKVQTSPSDPMMQLIIRIEKLEERRAVLWTQQDEILAGIEAVTNKRYSKILGWRYVSGMTMSQISEFLGVSERWARTLLRKVERRYYEQTDSKIV